ncbi:MAG: ATP-binding cassette domain-containing protein [Myxococcales bacterium]|nr:ATP-binding cassette domain-containing protein [Myxococcales bacterium]
MIELRGVRKEFPGPTGTPVVAVDGVSLRVAAGELLCLIGTSGCGKTTTMKMINRLVEPSDGEIRVDGRDIRERDPTVLRRGIGYVIQKGGLFPHLSVAGNVGLLCRLEGWERARIEARVAELLQLVNLAQELATRYPRELSGGQRQRVGVARALALDPPLVLMDEPFGALDPITRRQLHAELRQLQDRVGKTIVLVTHDLGEAFALGDRVALMDRGRIVQLGTEADFRERPATPFVEEFVREHVRGSGA